MVYDSRLQRGVQDRSFTPIKVAFHKDSTHEQMLSKFVESVWKDAPQNSNFFLSDGSGSSITSKNFEIDLRLLLMVQRRLCRGHWLTTCELLAFDTHPEHVSTVSGFLLNISTVSYLYTHTMCIIMLIV